MTLFPFPASFAAQTRVQLCSSNASAGIVIIGLDSAALLLHRSANENRVILHIGNRQLPIASVPDDTIDLRVIVRPGGQCAFACRTGAGWLESPQPFQSKEGKWIGAKIGLLSAALSPGHFADFQHFQFDPAPNRTVLTTGRIYWIEFGSDECLCRNEKCACIFPGRLVY